MLQGLSICSKKIFFLQNVGFRLKNPNYSQSEYNVEVTTGVEIR